MMKFQYLQGQELNRARTKHPKKFSSFHEAYAIILEEVDEFWENVKKDGTKEDMLSELVQIATMCQRAAEDLEIAYYTMTPKERCEWFDAGLAERGFVGIDNACSRGKCHKDEKHYVLVTDGLIIYSTCYHWDQPSPEDVVERWDWFDFCFDCLDGLMQHVDRKN